MGTLTLTTLANSWWGIAAGRKVTLHYVSVGSSLPVAQPNFFEYANVIEELLGAILDEANAATVEAFLAERLCTSREARDGDSMITR